MKNAFMTSIGRVLVDLRVAQTKHGRLRGKADARFEAAKARHAVEVATAAALLGISEASVVRWGNRTGKPTTRGGLS